MLLTRGWPGVLGVSGPEDLPGVGVPSVWADLRGVYEACSAESVLKRIPNRDVANRRAAGDMEAIR